MLNFGSCNIDHVYTVEAFVGPGETLSSGTYQTFPGGKGFNQSVAIAQAGGACSHVGRIGRDGEWL
ncbi:MAG: ribokinase, partial [Rhodospirillaceae bacterium TMED167]